MVVLCYYPIYCVRVSLDMMKTQVQGELNVWLTDDSDSIHSALCLAKSNTVSVKLLDSDTIIINMNENFDTYLTFFIGKSRCPKYYPEFLKIALGTLIQNGGIEEE